MDTSTVVSVQALRSNDSVQVQNEKQRGKEKEIRTESDWLRESAARHEQKGETVWALLYRNEAIRLETVTQ